MKEEPRLKKNQYCLHCIHIFKCKGAIDPKMCVNFEKRKDKKECQNKENQTL